MLPHLHLKFELVSWTTNFLKKKKLTFLISKMGWGLLSIASMEKLSIVSSPASMSQIMA